MWGIVKEVGWQDTEKLCFPLCALFLKRFFKLFYCCSITVVCIFSPPLYPTPAKTTSLPSFHPLFIFRGKGKEGEREGEKHWCERDSSVSCLSYAPQLGTEHPIQASALTRNQTGDLSLCRMMPNQLVHTSHGLFVHYVKFIVLSHKG